MGASFQTLSKNQESSESGFGLRCVDVMAANQVFNEQAFAAQAVGVHCYELRANF